MAVMVGCTPPGPLSEGEGTSQDSPAAARHPLSEWDILRAIVLSYYRANEDSNDLTPALSWRRGRKPDARDGTKTPPAIPLAPFEGGNGHPLKRGKGLIKLIKP